LQLLMRNKEYLSAGKTLLEFYQEGTHLRDLNFADAKRYLPSWLRPGEINICGSSLQNYMQKVEIGLPLHMTIQERQALDIRLFSVPSLVHYEDRMSMAWSREVRLPFLDYRIIEKLVPLPISVKIHQGWSKYIFRKAMEPFLPPEIIWRKDKKGFSNPSEEWLKNELRKTVLKYFNDGNSLIYKYGLVNQKNLLLKYKKYCDQEKRRGIISSKDIFNSLSLEIWLRKYACYIN
jgi:asparagine synthase (glutamine-hydrolysing)